VFLFSIYLLWNKYWQEYLDFNVINRSLALPQTKPLDMKDVYTIRDQFGSSFAPLSALLTGFAVVFSAVGLAIQARAANQREKERHEDKFEARFFRLFELWKENSPDKSETINKIHKDYYILAKTIHTSFPTNLEKFQKCYELIANQHEPYLSPYFRTLYHVFRYLKDSNIRNKQQYSNIVRAGLSGRELVLLAGNCLLPQGAKFKPLVERFHLLKHLPGDELVILTKDELREFFAPSAFDE